MRPYLGVQPTIDTDALAAALKLLKNAHDEADAATKAGEAQKFRREFEELTSQKALHDNKAQWSRP